jgi:hypothetical protein
VDVRRWDGCKEADAQIRILSGAVLAEFEDPDDAGRG